MRLDLFLKKNLLLLRSCQEFSSAEKEQLLKLPRSFWQKEIILGNVRVLKKIVKPSYSIDIGKLSSITIAWKYIKKNWNVFYREHLLKYPMPVDVILNKPDFIVVNKPAGLSVHPVFPISQRSSRKVSFIEGVISSYPNAQLVHRLDKETTGALLIAKNDKTKNHLKKQFKNRKVSKEYFAMVEGVFPYEKFKISGLIGKSANNPIKRVFNNPEITVKTKIINPKNSLTIGQKIVSGTPGAIEKAKIPANKIIGFWKKYLDNGREYTLLKLAPKTGRTHQLRVHLSALGFPIVGDKLYGNNAYKNLPFHCLHAFSIKWLGRNLKPYTAKAAEIIIFNKA